MRTRRRRKVICQKTGKVRYSTSQIANEELERIRITGWCWRQERRSYFCPACGGWHLTSYVDPATSNKGTGKGTGKGNGKGKKRKKGGKGNGQETGPVQPTAESTLPSTVVGSSVPAVDEEKGGG